MTKTLYICYFGMREPLVQTQVLPYLRELLRDGIDVTLLTFEPDLGQKWSEEQILTEKNKLAEQGIDWHMLAYHKRPSLPATAYDVFAGVRYIRKLMRTKPFDVLHARVHIPAVIAILVRKFSRHKPKILFDIRGFVPEEYADAGVWKKGGWLFRLAKRVENWIMRESDGFVILTEAARDVLFPESRSDGFDKLGRPVEVIPCCVDFESRFAGNLAELRDQVRTELNVTDRYVIAHVGSLTGLYLTPQIVEFLSVARARDPKAFALFLTQSNPDEIVSRLLEAGFTETDFLVRKVDQREVPGYLAASDIGLSFVQSSYATISRSPTKIPEYLACGLPVIANTGVGDVDRLLLENRVGAVVDSLDRVAYDKALAEVGALDKNVHQRAVKVGHSGFDLQEVGGARYRRLYSRIVARQIKTLHICYFGVREPLVQTQVLPYLRQLRKYVDPESGQTGSALRPTRISLLTFEPVDPPEAEGLRRQLEETGIDWTWLTYHKRVSAVATGWDILRGTIFVWRYIGRNRPDILHGRVHVPTLMGALARKFSSHNPKLLFDIRGFFPEEYADAGLWPEGGLMFRTAKRVERWLLKEADGFVVLTEKARQILFPETGDGWARDPESGGRHRAGIHKTQVGHFEKLGRPVEVIPCCVDLSRFSSVDRQTRETVRRELGFEDRRVVTYVGSFGGWYLTDEMLDFFAAAREEDPRTAVMILTARDKESVIDKLRSRNLRDGDFFVESVEPEHIPKYLCATDVAVSFIKTCYSKISSSPTKIGEYLACGLPIVANRGVGDVDDLIGRNRVGVLVEDFSARSFRAALEEIDRLGPVGDRCRAFAARELGLDEVGGHRYRRLYARLMKLDGKEDYRDPES